MTRWRFAFRLGLSLILWFSSCISSFNILEFESRVTISCYWPHTHTNLDPRLGPDAERLCLLLTSFRYGAFPSGGIRELFPDYLLSLSWLRSESIWSVLNKKCSKDVIKDIENFKYNHGTDVVAAVPNCTTRVVLSSIEWAWNLQVAEKRLWRCAFCLGLVKKIRAWRWFLWERLPTLTLMMMGYVG